MPWPTEHIGLCLFCRQSKDHIINMVFCEGNTCPYSGNIMCFVYNSIGTNYNIRVGLIKYFQAVVDDHTDISPLAEYQHFAIDVLLLNWFNHMWLSATCHFWTCFNLRYFSSYISVCWCLSGENPEGENRGGQRKRCISCCGTKTHLCRWDTHGHSHFNILNIGDVQKSRFHSTGCFHTCPRFRTL